MRKTAASGATVLAAIALFGCSSGVAEHTHRAATATVRGTELPSFSCGAAADGKAVSVLPALVVKLRVCPVGAPEPFNRPSHPISLTRGSPRFGSFVAALSAPDEAAAEGQMCPDYAELLPQLIASTGSTALLVHIPSDGCGHSLPAARAALSTVIGTTQ